MYFLLDSKPELFRQAVTHALTRDLDLIARDFSNLNEPLSERLIAAFDRSAGSYIGPLTGDTHGVFDADPSLLGSVLDKAPQRFKALVSGAVTATHPADGAARTQTLISASIGIKHQVATRQDSRHQLTAAVELLLN